MLVVQCPEPRAGRLLAARLPGSAIVFYHSDYALHLRTRQDLQLAGVHNARLTFGAWYEPEGPGHSAGIVYLPRERLVIELTLALIARAVRPGAPVWLVGEIRSGARAARPLIEQWLGRINRVNAARHAILYQAVRSPGTLPPIGPDHWVVSRQVQLHGRPVTLVSLPGVFSHGRLDPGTGLLVHTLADPMDGRILDFGCGSGIIGAFVRLNWPNAQVEMVDSNALAVAAATRTLRANGLTEEGVWTSDVFSDVPRQYRLIVSNPPFHSGIRTDYAVMQTFVREAGARLLRGGRLRLVANRFLKYPALLQYAFGDFSVVAENRSYRVYEAIRAGRPRGKS